MHRMSARLFSVVVLGAVLMSGCATPPPAAPARLGLRLAPSALGQAISVQQHLKVERAGRIDELDAALEVDASGLRLVGLAFGQRVLSIDFDGDKLQSWRHVMLPAQVKAEDVLEDVQLVLWPAEAIAARLPAGWHIEDDGLRRALWFDGTAVATVSYSALPRWSGTVVLDNHRYHYRLTITAAE